MIMTDLLREKSVSIW